MKGRVIGLGIVKIVFVHLRSQRQVSRWKMLRCK